METIDLKIENHLAIVTLNRPEVMNSFNYQMLTELDETVELLQTNKEARVIVFTGAGDRAFSAGADLKERKTLDEQGVRRNVRKIKEVFQRVAELPQPTIAALNGFTFGGGFELALACDFRMAASNAKMGLTETSWAIIPGAGGTQRLPRLIGESKAMELILTAQKLTADEALELGILTEVTELSGLMDKVTAFAERMLANGPVALQQAKYAVKNGMNTDLHTGLQIEAKAYEITIPTEDRVEALAAFNEKRKAEFKGR